MESNGEEARGGCPRKLRDFFLIFEKKIVLANCDKRVNYGRLHWRPTKVETTGATLNYETLILRLFETFLDFETKKQVVPRHAGTP